MQTSQYSSRKGAGLARHMYTLGGLLCLIVIFGSTKVLAQEATVVLTKMTKTKFVQKVGEYRVGQKLPHFTLRKGSGSPIAAHQLEYGSKGTIFTYFWRSCSACLVGLKALGENETTLKGKGVRVVMVHVREPSPTGGALTPSDIETWLKSHGIDGVNVLYDQKGGLRKSGIISDDGTASLPVTIMVDHQRIIRGIATEEGPDYVTAISRRLKIRL